MKYTINLWMAMSIMLLLLAGCDSSVMEDGSVTLTLHVNAHVNGQPLSTNSSTTYDVNGATISFESARIYLSEITLINTQNEAIILESEPLTVPAKGDNDENISHTVQDQVVLVRHDAGITAYDIGSLQPGEYKEIRFKVGIAGATNRVDPSQVPPEHPLAKQTDRNNHWNWNAGYLFLRVDGLVDSDDDGTPDAGWDVHLGTEKFLREVTLSHRLTLHHETPASLNIDVNYAEFLKNVDLNDPDQRICHTMNNLPVANAVADQIIPAFQIANP